MPAELLENAPAVPGTGGPRGGGDRPRGEGGSSGEGSGGLFGDPARFGLWAFLGTVSMLFIGFTSAVILRRASGDWRPLPAPPVLWFNTAALLASSASLEAARRRLRAWDARSAQALLGVTGLLGGLFLTGQVLAWRELAARGIFLASNPHSSFFYLLTGVHGAHLLGGLAWFAVAFLHMRRSSYVPDGDGLRLFATYWHFLDALWVYLLFLLFVL